MTTEERRLEELILYVAARMRADNHAGLGRIKLAKMIFFSDFLAYARFGESITGAHYHADQFGPSPVEELLALRDLQAARRLDFEAGYRKQQVPVVVGRPADTSLFEERQLELVNEVLDRYRAWPASEVVEVAHAFPGWRFFWDHGHEKAIVPYESVFWSRRRVVSQAELEHADELAQEFGLASTT